MAKTLAEMKRLERNLDLNMRYCKRRVKRDLYCSNCDYIMPHIHPLNTGPYRYTGVRWECVACGQITEEEKEG